MKGFLLFFIIIIGPTYAALPEAWDSPSDPTIMSESFRIRFEKLPTEGIATGKDKYWPGDYWPIKDGGINFRWNSKEKKGFDLVSPTIAVAKQMSLEQLAELSPAEKFDLLNADYSYPLSKEVSANTYKDAQNWEGICHGWAPASMNHNEPRAKILTNKDGIKIPFGSGDIKGLISYYYAHYHQVENTFQIGYRCFRPGRLSRNTYCKNDLNAGAFHIVIANKIGIKKQGIIADMDRFSEVWNHPIQGYQTEIIRTRRPGPLAAKNAVLVVEVKTQIRYIVETHSFWQTSVGTEDNGVKFRNYQYALELDEKGDIVGGEWISKQRPDFLWLMSKPSKYKSPFQRLPELLND